MFTSSLYLYLVVSLRLLFRPRYRTNRLRHLGSLYIPESISLLRYRPSLQNTLSPINADPSIVSSAKEIPFAVGMSFFPLKTAQSLTVTGTPGHLSVGVCDSAVCFPEPPSSVSQHIFAGSTPARNLRPISPRNTG